MENIEKSRFRKTYKHKSINYYHKYNIQKYTVINVPLIGFFEDCTCTKLLCMLSSSFYNIILKKNSFIKKFLFTCDQIFFREIAHIALYGNVWL